MPKTPPLLLPQTSAFQYATHDAPQPMLPPSDILAFRSHQLSSVVEESDDENGDKAMKGYSYEESPQTKLPKQYQHERTLTDPGNHQHRRPLTTNDDENQSMGSSQPLPGKRPHEGDHPASSNLETIYQEVMDQHGYIKDKIDTVFSELRQAEADTEAAINELCSYNKVMTSRCNTVRQRWLQIQAHSLDIITTSNSLTQ